MKRIQMVLRSVFLRMPTIVGSDFTVPLLASVRHFALFRRAHRKSRHGRTIKRLCFTAAEEAVHDIMNTSKYTIHPACR